MCRTPHHFLVCQEIAEDSNAPQHVRDAAQQRLSQPNLHAIVTSAATTIVGLPVSGSADFACTIYSMNNKDWKADAEDRGPITNWDEIVDLPGTLYQDTKGYRIKNADGSDLNDLGLDKTFSGFRTVWTFHQSCFNRNSVDGQGLELRGTIHLARGYDNAFWSSDKKAMFFGDGGRSDGQGWLPTLPGTPEAAHLVNWHAPYSLEILGHELTHGVVQYTANLGAQQSLQDKWAEFSEADTLNEHIADCFGMMVKQFSNNEDALNGSWEFAPEWYSQTAMTAMGWEKGYIRTFLIPQDIAKQPDKGPKHMTNLVPFLTKDEDPRDGHVNCGIPNHAFYLAAQSFGGKTWDSVGKIWYAALTDSVFQAPTNQTFKGWRQLTTSYAEKLFGEDGKEKVDKAWQQVGL